MATADASAAPAVALPPHIFSNVLAENRNVPTSVTVVLLDLLNTSWTDQMYARKALLKFLQQIQPQDRIAIFALGHRSLTLLHDYTTDSASLVARLQKATGRSANLHNCPLRSDCARAAVAIGSSGTCPDPAPVPPPPRVSPTPVSRSG